MSPNDADGMANSVDPDQTARSLIWVCTVCSGISVRKLRIITVITESENASMYVSKGILCFKNIYVLRKVRIGTIPELSCAKWEFSLCRAK